MKKIAKIMGITILVLSVLSGCTSEENNSAEETVEIRIGVLRTADSLPIYLADQEALFEEYGALVELVEFGSASDQSKAMESGAIDGMMTDMVVQCLLQKGGTPMRTVTTALGADVKEGKFMVVSYPGSDISTVEDLEGKSVAISEGTMMEYLVDSYCDTLGISVDRLEKVNIPSLSLRYETLMAGEVDAAILPDPLGTLAVMNEGTAVIDDTELDRNISRSVIAFNETFIQDNPSEIEKFIEGYNAAIDRLNENNSEDMELIFEIANVPEVMQDVWEVPHFTKDAVPDEEEVERLMTWMIDKELLEQAYTYDQVVDISFK